MTITDYKTSAADNTETLDRNVKKLIAQGYQPFGSPYLPELPHHCRAPVAFGSETKRADIVVLDKDRSTVAPAIQQCRHLCRREHGGQSPQVEQFADMRWNEFNFARSGLPQIRNASQPFIDGWIHTTSFRVFRVLCTTFARTQRPRGTVGRRPCA
jgi:hypothetical protein